MLQIVHNMVYIRWLEDLRTLLLAEHLPLEEQIASGYSPVLTRTDIQYKWPVRFGDAPTGLMWMSHLGATKWQVQAEIVVGEKTAAAATQWGYFADLRSLRPTRIPQQLRDRYQQAFNDPRNN